jgi:hypothetical protein
MWTLTELKIYCANITSFTLSLTDIDTFLKITLLSVTIGYTLHKWYLLRKKNKGDE